MPYLKGKRGFTIIELAIVAVIIGITATLAVPQFDKTITKFKLKTTGRNITSTLRLARSYAIAQKNQFGVYFDDSNSSYVLFKDVANLSSYTFEHGDSTLKTYELPHNVVGSPSFSNNVIIFLPDGSASSSGYFNLWSEEQEIYDYFMVDVLASTGRVKLVKSGDY